MKAPFASAAETCGIEISPGCSNRCLFCAPNGIPRASKPEIKKQEIKVYKNLIGHKKRGYKAIEITGHDPLEYDLIAPLIKHIKHLGFEYVFISTNGVRLSDGSFLDDLISSGVDCLRVPLYGPNAKMHDSITQVKGSFNKVVRGVKNLKKKAPNIELWMHSLIMQQNKEDPLKIIKTAQMLNADKFSLSVPCVGNDDYSFYVPLKDLKNIMRRIVKGPSKYNNKVFFMDIPYCVFGSYDARVCSSSPPNLGEHNQPQKDFKTLINSLPSYRLKVKVGMCGRCKLSGRCGGFYTNDIKRFGYGDLKPIL